ncbi:hypothetical protein [Companilactobacillus sp. HBUAS56257]|jgi:hypothetical protein|uniref:hypothetical protein n=1 Tax=Companilactobacillus sp. HBUAS56257 TaxID=3109360 RepID=UPI002FF4119E
MEKTELIKRYVKAANNLYNLIPITQVYRIIKLQNPEMSLTATEFRDVLQQMSNQNTGFEIERFDAWYKGDNWQSPEYIISEYLFEDDNIYDIMNNQEGELYNIPEKETFLKHANEFYFVENDALNDLRDYLIQEFKLIPDDVEDIVEETQGMMQVRTDENDEFVDFLINDFKKFSISIKTKAQEDQLRHLLNRADFNLQIPFYRNFSEKQFRSNVDPFDEIDLVDGEIILSDDLVEQIKTAAVDVDELNKLVHCNYQWSDNMFENIAYADKASKAINKIDVPKL